MTLLRPMVLIFLTSVYCGSVSAKEAAANVESSATYDGSALYLANCSNCHGLYGEGDGAVTPDLSVVLLDLRYLSARNSGAYPETFVRDIIDGRTTRATHGPSGMPVWGAEFTRTEGFDDRALARVQAKVDALVEFLRRIQISD